MVLAQNYVINSYLGPKNNPKTRLSWINVKINFLTLLSPGDFGA